MCNLGDFPDELNIITTNFDRIERCGFILYKIVDQKILFGFGVDTRHDDYTDFGGGVKRVDRTIIQGGLRELQEESLGILGNIQPDELLHYLSIYTKKTLIAFVRINSDSMKIEKEFRNRYLLAKRNGKYPEVKDLIWISVSQFMDLIQGKYVKERRMFEKVRKILKLAYEQENFINELHH